MRGECLGRGFHKGAVQLARRHALQQPGGDGQREVGGFAFQRLAHGLAIARDGLVRVSLQPRRRVGGVPQQRGAFGLGGSPGVGDNALPLAGQAFAFVGQRRGGVGCLAALRFGVGQQLVCGVATGGYHGGDGTEQEARQQPDENEDVHRLQCEGPKVDAHGACQTKTPAPLVGGSWGEECVRQPACVGRTPPANPLAQGERVSLVFTAAAIPRLTSQTDWRTAEEAR